MTEVKQMDLFGARSPQMVLEQGDFRAVIAPEKGGRVVELSRGGKNALHRLYPEGYAFGPYTEYGGLEEHVGSAPGTVWDVAWETESVNGSVALAAYSTNTLVRKHFSLVGDAPLLRVDYELSNYDPNFARFTFGLHPELVLGGDHRKVNYHVPLDGHIESGGYTEAGFRKYVSPYDGWSAATAGELLFLQMLPPGVTDCLEIYYPKVDTHLVLQPVVFGVGLSPEMRVRFPYFLYFGPGDVSRAEEIYAQYLPELRTEYAAAEPQPDSPKPSRKNPKNVDNFNFQEGFEHAFRNEDRDRDRQRRNEDRDRRREEERMRREEERGRRREVREVRDIQRGIPGEGRAWPHFDAPMPPGGFEHPIPPVPPAPPAGFGPVGAPQADLKEERMIILQGLSEGKYSVEDALRLLDKLEKMRF
jgi:hypothetical protein